MGVHCTMVTRVIWSLEELLNGTPRLGATVVLRGSLLHDITSFWLSSVMYWLVPHLNAFRYNLISRFHFSVMIITGFPWWGHLWKIHQIQTISCSAGANSTPLLTLVNTIHLYHCFAAPFLIHLTSTTKYYMWFGGQNSLLTIRTLS